MFRATDKRCGAQFIAITLQTVCAGFFLVMRLLIAVIIVVGALVPMALAERHSDLHRAFKHHSSLESAGHRGDSHKIDSWIVKPDQCDDSAQLVATLNRHLSTGTLRVDRITRTGFWVLGATPSVSADELTALLMSEQRAGLIEWFHRDGVAARKSH